MLSSLLVLVSEKRRLKGFVCLAISLRENTASDNSSVHYRRSDFPRVSSLYCQNSLMYAILLLKQGRCEVRIAPLNSNAQTNRNSHVEHGSLGRASESLARIVN